MLPTWGFLLCWLTNNAEHQNISTAESPDRRASLYWTPNTKHQMNKIISFFVLIFVPTILTHVNAQPVPDKYDINQLLQEVNIKMTSIQAVRYNQYKTVFYKNDNYRENDTSDIFFCYHNIKGSFLPMYQINEIGYKRITIYNGTENFTLNKSSMSLDVEVDTSALSLIKKSFFRQSWANIRNLLPEFIRNDSIQKSIADTVILNKKYFVLKIYYPRKRFNALTGVTDIGIDTIQWRYELLIDKSSLLPQQFNVSIQTPHNTEDFIRVMFDKIKVNPELPNERSWYFSTYQNQYPNHSAKRKDLVRSAAKMPAWELPTYISKSMSDTLTSETLKGKIILLEFWIKGCGYCLSAMPYLNEIQGKFNKDSFQLITINCYDTRQDVGFFHTKYPPNFKMCYNGRQLAESLGIYGFPMTLLIDQEGTIVNVAPFDNELLESKISEILNSSSKKITSNSMK